MNDHPNPFPDLLEPMLRVQGARRVSMQLPLMWKPERNEAAPVGWQKEDGL